MKLFVKKVEKASYDIDELCWREFSTNMKPLLIHLNNNKYLTLCWQ